MLKKFLLQLIIIAIVVCFFGLNFETKINIKFWFNDLLTLKDISLFGALAGAYLLGVCTFIPFYIAKIVKKNKKTDPTVDNE